MEGGRSWTSTLGKTWCLFRFPQRPQFVWFNWMSWIIAKGDILECNFTLLRGPSNRNEYDSGGIPVGHGRCLLCTGSFAFSMSSCSAPLPSTVSPGFPALGKDRLLEPVHRGQWLLARGAGWRSSRLGPCCSRSPSSCFPSQPWRSFALALPSEVIFETPERSRVLFILFTAIFTTLRTVSGM